MYLINVIGMTGQGKSPFVRSYIEGRRCFVYDVNNEYGMKTKYAGQTPVGLSDNPQDPRSRFTNMDKKLFVEMCMQKTDTICVLEDATAFFRGAQQEQTMLMITRKLFNRNTYIFVWHSINRVPPFFMELSNYVVLFKTGDQPDTVRKKYPLLYPYYLQLLNAPKGTRLNIPITEQ